MRIANKVLQLHVFFRRYPALRLTLCRLINELLDAAAHPLFLISAYDIAHCPLEHCERLETAALEEARKRHSNFDGQREIRMFLEDDLAWTPERYHQIIQTRAYHLCFCHDNQRPPNSAEAIAEDVVCSVLRDQEHALGSVVPIIHGLAELIASAARMVAEQLCPVLLAIPERA